jgi:hypothetical protein
VHALHWWAESLKTHERDAIPKGLPKVNTFGMTQLSLTVSSNSPKTSVKSKKRLRPLGQQSQAFGMGGNYLRSPSFAIKAV